MKTLRIEIPNYAGRDIDLKKISYLATKYDLDYDAFSFPVLKIFDNDTDDVILESEGLKKCYISGEDSAIEQFLAEMKEWIFSK